MERFRTRLLSGTFLTVLSFVVGGGSFLIFGLQTFQESRADEMKNCFYPNATDSDGQQYGWTIWCESDYVNCHKGSQDGDAI